ncbi:DUF3140 domain-containing protein [Streptomyces sp. CRN 30]|uniref:DUF3140 domain-containing protein n=1 Tax=Streptomyces sp. CRN 30 TaxID=3075613 RepID=UPI002A83171E|nr:DUF3140 domain-containing protein [Streptomyces sp. CRN 30]
MTKGKGKGDGDGDDRDGTIGEFNDAVNMSPGELEKWLETDESKSVGQSKGGGESVGHEMGRRIVALKRTKKGDLSDDDVAHMSKVVGYVHRHMAQRPDGDVKETPWRYSLMNWGHDPVK